MGDFEYDFFISRAGADKEVAVRIADLLVAAGRKVYIQDYDFAIGHDFLERMENGLGRSRRVLSVVSEAYFDESRFTLPELRAAFRKDPSGRERRLVIVRAADCTIPDPYGSRVFDDLFDRDDETFEQTVADLAAAFGENVSEVAAEKVSATGPSVWNVPLPNEHFTGRRALLDELGRRLDSEATMAVTQSAAMHGMGGVGKTQVALRFCYEHAAEYDLVWWIDAETEAETDFAALADEVGVEAPPGTDQREVVAAVRKALEQRDRWLLVFDNAEKPEAIRELRPQFGGHVLVTSRNPKWGKTAGTLSVETWTRPESVEFLATATGRDEPDAADALAAELGDLPLALAQAAGYVEATGFTLAEYLEEYLDRREALWAQEAAPEDYAKTVATTWELSRQEIGDGVDVLRLCAFLAPEGITRELLAARPEALPKKLAKTLTDALAFNKVVARLRRFSLVTAEGGVLSVHRLLQAVVRDGIRKQDREDWLERAARTVYAAVPYDQNVPETWGPSAQMVTHAMAVDGHAKTVRLEGNPVGRALDESGQALHDLGQYSLAREVLLSAVEVARTDLGDEHVDVATSCSNLALVEKDLGNLGEAKRLLERAVESGTEAFEADHPTLAVRYSNLAVVERDLGNLGEAKRLLERAIEIEEQAFEADHPTLASSYSNLAMVEQGLGNVREAKRLMGRAVEIEEQAFAADHPTLAVSYSNLATVEQGLGNLGEAKRLLERAVEIKERVFEADHPSLAFTYNNLADVLWRLGEHDAARLHWRTAYRIFSTRLGVEHPNTKVVAEWLRAYDPDFDG